MLNFFWTIALFCLAACDSTSDHRPAQAWPLHTIQGRDTDERRQAVYQVHVPPEWIRHDPLPDESIVDTKKALCEFLIYDQGEIIRIAIHNFPTDHIDERIPPTAQVTRWQKQFDLLLPELSHIAPQSFNGFSGLLFTGVGTILGTETMMLAWIMQIAPEHYRALSDPKPLFKQMRADFTIKAVGPKLLMGEYLDTITAFALSFELIDEIQALR